MIEDKVDQKFVYAKKILFIRIQSANHRKYPRLLDSKNQIESRCMSKTVFGTKKFIALVPF